MQLQRVPGAPLSEYIDCLWYLHNSLPTHAKERLLPTGTIELVIPLGEETSRFYEPKDLNRFHDFRGPLLLGAQSTYVVIDSATSGQVLGVHFRPGGAFPFLGVPASEVQNQVLSLEVIWGKQAAWLFEQICAAKTPGAKLAVLERILLARADAWELEPAVAFAIAELGQMRPVSEVVDQIGINARRFIQLFRDQVGLTPKLFSRVCRFQDVILNIESANRPIWADDATACGYYDQAHFIHDFRNFSGLSPVGYLLGRTSRLNHVPL